MRISRTARVVLAATLTLGLGLGAGAATVVPAGAATASFVATPNGMVGMEQEVLIYAPRLKGQGITVGFALGSTGSNQQTVVGANGYAYMNWTPNLPGAWTISGLGNALGIGSTTVNIASMGTTTELYVPTQATSNAVTQVAVVVSSLGGTIAPDGSVTLQSIYGQQVGTQGLTPLAGGTSSYALFNWTPQILGPFPLVANYNPASGATTGSTSGTATSLIVANAGALELRLPSSFRVGVPTAMSALVTPTNTVGTAAISINTGFASGSMPLVNGVATAQWTPTQQGNQTITSAFSSSTPGGPSARVNQAINVLAPLPADNVSITTSAGTWGPGRPNVIRQGSNVLMNMSASSGSPVLVSEIGPCAINGAIITGLGAGTCTVTAQTVGGNGYSEISEQFIVTVQAKPKKRR